MERNEYCFGGEKEGDSKRGMHSVYLGKGVFACYISRKKLHKKK